MENKYYKVGKERAAQVEALFARIAKHYDLINDLQSFGLHRYWKRKVVRLGGTGPGRALDVCTGTGDLAFLLRSRRNQVVGLDFTLEMLAMGEARNSGKVTFIHGDALKLPFADGTFELVTVGYGLRNLADLEGGLKEMLRVLQRGGRLVILDFGKPPNSLWRALYFSYLKTVVPIFGKIFCGDSAAYAYILESLKHYPAQEGVAKSLRDLGAENSTIHNFMGGMMSINVAQR
jgi:demethylmenaquinone methyltransferase/2-methoxy-6-polyprenyl-1,4-benzoquinol methylase